MPKLHLAVVVVLAFTVSANAQPTGPLPPNPAHNWLREPGLSQVPTDSFLFVSVKASKLWDNPAAKPFREWVAAQKDDPLTDMFGVEAADLDRVTLFAPTFSSLEKGEPLILVATRKPYNEARIRKHLRTAEERRDRGQHDRIIESDGPYRWVVLVDDRTLLLVPENLERTGIALITQLMARKPDGPLTSALSDAAHHDLTFAVDIKPLRGLFGNVAVGKNDPFKPFDLLLKADTATLTADFDKTAKGKVVLSFPDAATGKLAGSAMEEGIKTIIDGLEKSTKRPEAKGFENRVFEAVLAVLKNAKVTTDGVKVVASADVPYADEVPKLVAAFPKSFGRTRGDLKAKNNLKQLALAMHNIHDTYMLFPGDVQSNAKDAPVWSWRVQLLPYLELQNLYLKLDTKKPWDDPANLKVLETAEMPKIFEHPGRPAPKGHTYFRIFSLPKNAKGTDTPFFVEGKRGPRFGDIADGLSNTFMIVEAGEAVPWYKPDVLAYDGKLPLPQLGDKEADMFIVAMCDGTVRALKPSKLDEKLLRALITRAGDEVFSLPDR